MIVGKVDRNNTPMVLTFDEAIVTFLVDSLEHQIQMTASVYHMFGHIEDEGEDYE